ncbi:MAG: bifunctional diaminohydroxyphosphoribosylaminopyrimidine deaminase/5-amino-6-(5-phosphoribosylamino)uracil reductase RibD [Candidatus Omnitrophica bacterium]|nr:bifunctional diaminohydroxyphosphoribosylaminopyrimidine deaminase/5-amino-6-(5-phosphoribosylamino)uracil reductase RibD [Candidatus Omnitrophota bacterium]
MHKKIEKYMDLALRLSLQAKGLTSPNPLVGVVIVKNDNVVSTGFHKRAGLEHAEIVALRKAGKKTKGATLYVTLEPCSSFGRTPPCTKAIIQSGIKKVVVGMRDPNPKHCGKGIRILKSHGIDVISGALENHIRQINQPFIKYITKGMPYVTLKIAQSLDGKIATRTGDSKWITSFKSREFSHKIRNNFDAIMVGINTVLKDKPLLNPDKKIKEKKFYKIILDTHLKIKFSMHIFNNLSNFPVVIATCKESIIKKSKKIKSLVNEGSIILGIEKKNGLLNIKDLLRKLAQLEITNVLVEGGGRVAGSLLDKNLIDYVLFFISPKIIGGNDSISSIQGKGVNKVRDAQVLKTRKIERFGEDLLIEGAVRLY